MSLCFCGNSPQHVVYVNPPHLGHSVPINFNFVVANDSPEIQALILAFDSLDAYVLQTGNRGIIPLSEIDFYILEGNTISFDNQPTASDGNISYTTGTVLLAAIVYIDNCRVIGLNIEQTAAIFLEELLHAAYRITDETEVKRMVVDILSLSLPSIKFPDFYNNMPGSINFT